MRWFWPAVTAAIVADGLNLRRRADALTVLAPTDEPEGGGYRVVVAAGVTVDDATRRAAVAHARRDSLDVLDLVPRDLPVERLIAVLRMTDPATFRDDPLAPGLGALHAVVVSDDVARRVGIEATEGLTPSEIAELTSQLKKYAPTSTDLALAPGLASVGSTEVPLDDLRTVMGTPFALAAQVGDVALLAGAARSRRPWALAAMAARVAQPVLAAGGSAEPRDLPLAAPRQLVSSARGLARALGRSRDADARGDREAREQDRKRYDEWLADGIDRFFEPRRDDCPLCGSTELRVRLEGEDLIQCKPGTFVLDECGGCGHIFQNPAVNDEGLDFYYADFYDGAADQVAEGAFALMPTFYEARAEMVRGHGQPRRWLDVGGSHGHFCLAAKQWWPDTAFEALDRSDAVEEAERRGWTERSYRGLFPELAGSLAGRFDVVSMFHYLEHTRDLGAELDATATVLAPGGLVLIEVPDASSRLASLLGKFWWPWVQPQHLHFPSVANLSALLGERGFTVVDVVEGPAHVPFDMAAAAGQFVNWVRPPVSMPWRPRPSTGERVARGGALAAGAALTAGALAVDVALYPLGGRFKMSNSYRLLARLDS